MKETCIKIATMCPVERKMVRMHRFRRAVMNKCLYVLIRLLGMEYEAVESP